jgi:hypothetical protein
MLLFCADLFTRVSYVSLDNYISILLFIPVYLNGAQQYYKVDTKDYNKMTLKQYSSFIRSSLLQCKNDFLVKSDINVNENERK